MTPRHFALGSALVLLCHLGGFDADRLHAQAGGCLTFGSGTATVVGSTTTVRPNDAPCGSTTAQLTAARNEFESFQLVVRAGAGALTGVSVAASALSGQQGSIPATNITVYRVGNYTAQIASDGEGGTGQWPDALIPSVDPWFGEQRNAFPVDVPAGQNRIAWVDVFVPQGTPAGTYSGTVTIASAQSTLQVPVSLRVLTATLPSTSSLASSFSTSYRGPCDAHTGHFACNWDETQRWALHALYAQAALDNRFTISNPVPMGVNEGPTAAQAAQFRTYILPLLRSEAPFHNHWRGPRLQGAQLTSFNLHWDCGVGCLTSWRNFAMTAPTFDDKAFLYCVDEPGNNVEAWDKCRASRANAAQAWAALPLLTTATIQDTTAAGMATSINILTPVINRMHDKDNGAVCCRGNQRSKYDAFLQLAGNRVWMYTSNMSFSSDETQDPYWDGWAGYAIDQPASQSRAMGWLAFSYDTTGELYWQTTEKLATAWQAGGLYTQGGNGDGTLFYPGTPAVIGGQSDIPIESIRMKRIRDGREDYEYLELLTAKGQRDFALTVARQLFPSTYQTTVTQQALDNARASLIAKLEETALTPPAAPVPVGPSGVIGWAQPFLYWKASATATDYIIWIDDVTGHKATVSYNSNTLICQNQFDTCEMPSPVTLTGKVRFWVQAKNAAGVSPWSTEQSFIVQSSAPSVEVLSLYPVIGTAAAGTARLWARVQNTSFSALPANTTIWFYVEGPAWTGTHWVGAASAAGLAPVADTWVMFDWKVPLSAAGGSYTFWARAYTADVISAWSVGQSFSVTASPTLLTITAVYPLGPITRGGTAVLWARVRNDGSGAPQAGTKVWFWVSGPGWTGTNWVGGTVIPAFAPGAEQWFAFQWSVPASAPPGTYTYWAQAWSPSAAISEWSAGQTFEIR